MGGRAWYGRQILCALSLPQVLYVVRATPLEVLNILPTVDVVRASYYVSCLSSLLERANRMLEPYIGLEELVSGCTVRKQSGALTKLKTG